MDTTTQPLDKISIALSSILIVDDDIIITTMLEGILPQDKYTFKSVSTSGKALEELIDYKYDIMLLDGNLPGISGFKLLKYCKKYHPLMEVVMISGEQDINKVVGSLKDGAFDFISKPFSAQKVLDVLDKVIEHKKANFKNLYGKTQTLLKIEEKIVLGYKVIKTLGVGTSGIVTLLQSNTDKKDFKALKILKNEEQKNLSQEAKIDRFLRESKIMEDINHNNVVKIFDSGIYKEETQYILMEYVKGTTLTECIRNNTLSLESKIDIIAKLASALYAIHELGVLHRDLKPANIVVTDDLQPKILDFGIARVKDSSLTMAYEVLGSPAYISPENYSSVSRNLTPATDIFSLGIISYEMLTGEKPFWEDTVSELISAIVNKAPENPIKLNSNLSNEIVAILGGMLNKNLKLRYSSADKIYNDIQKLKTKKMTTTIMRRVTSTFSRPVWK